MSCLPDLRCIHAYLYISDEAFCMQTNNAVCQSQACVSQQVCVPATASGHIVQDLIRAGAELAK